MFTLLSVWFATLGGHVELKSPAYPMVFAVRRDSVGDGDGIASV